MAEDKQIIINDIPDEQFDEDLQGLIIDEDQSQIYNRWIFGGATALILVIIVSWLYVYFTRTPEQILYEKLSDYKTLSAMTKEVAAVLSETPRDSERLRNAIETAIDITNTPLRRYDHPEVPYIDERHVAMVYAIEGLLYLDIEGIIDLEDPFDKQWYDMQLNRLGEQRIGFMEEGHKQQVPLLKSAWIRKEIREEESLGEFASRSRLELLDQRLAIASQEESFTVVPIAQLLGSWYRYNDDLEYAERCFQIGRKYVEGYTLGRRFYPGRRPQVLNALWDEYVGCIEALAESALQNKQYRQARSYLIRIFNTSMEGMMKLRVVRDINAKLDVVNDQIFKLNNDIKIIKRAIDAPMQLASFPQYNLTDRNISWPGMLNLLGNAPYSSEKTPLKRLWKSLSPSTKKKIIERSPSYVMTDDVQNDIINSLNSLVQSDDFYNKVSVDVESLTEKGQDYYGKSSLEDLPPTEKNFLNRDILDWAFGNVVDNNFVLSDGSRLDNSLSMQQFDKLMALYAEEIGFKNINDARREELKRIVDGMYQNKLTPRLADLQMELVILQRYWEETAAANEVIFDRERLNLRRLNEKMEELESQDVIDVYQLRRLQLNEEMVRNRQLEAKLQYKAAINRLATIEDDLKELTVILEKKLAGLEERQAMLVKRQHSLRLESFERQEPLLQYLERQIVLHEKYLQMLLGLKATESDVTVQNLYKERQEIDDKIRVLRTRILALSGDEREQAEVRLGILEEKQRQIVEEFDRLFGPLREVVLEISKEEEKVWEAEKILEDTRQEILTLVGDKDSIGTIAEKSKKRTDLLLMQAQQMLKDPKIDEQIVKLNEEIAQDHANLDMFLQREEMALAILEAFYPYISEIASQLRKSDLSGLREYLKEQGELAENYRQLRREQALYKDIYYQNSIVLENLKMISDSLESPELSAVEANKLSRAMQNILEARNKLRHDRRLMKLTANSSFVQQQLNAVSARGIELDVLSIYQIENEMGLNINEYRRVFDEREAIVRELESILIEKNLLEEQQIKAGQNHDQIQVDALAIKIAELEDVINVLSRKEIDVNSRLRAFANDYVKHFDHVKRYYDKLQPQMAELEKQLEEIQKKLAANDQALRSSTQDLFNTALRLKKIVKTIQIDDLKDIDSIIAKQEKELEHLLEMMDLKRRENYYKVKALWLIGKSFYAQSRLESFSMLVGSQHISMDMLEDEKRGGDNIFDEFDENYIYSESFLGGASGEDENDANFHAWIEFLEQNALRFFKEEIPQYVAVYADFGEDGDTLFGLGRKEDCEAFAMRARFLTGEIYMHRAIRYLRASFSDKHVPFDGLNVNEQVRRELNLARSAFLNFLDFVSSVRVTEEVDGAQEFPVRTRRPIKLIEAAQVYLGVISSLKGNCEQSINHYRDILMGLAEKVMAQNDTGDLVQKDLPVGQVDPMLLEAYEYQVDINPFYASLLSMEPFAHEILYRLGDNYAHLAHREHSAFLNTTEKDTFTREEHEERFRKYAFRAIAYWSQLVLTQSYSPYRRAALLQRGLLKNQLGDNEGAIEDLQRVLNTVSTFARDSSALEITAKGDVIREINPSRAYVAFELGKILFEQREYAAANDAFAQAYDDAEDRAYVIKAKVGYAESLVAAKKWPMAMVMLQELIKESQEVSERYQYLYPPELFINLGITQQAFGNFEEAILDFKKVFKFAPREIVKDNGDLDLSNPQGMNILETDYRDAIRPLAVACMDLGEVFLLERDYNNAKKYFTRAETLFRLIPWKNDRILRHWEKDVYQAYRRENIFKARWGKLKTDALALSFSSLNNYRKEVESEDRHGITLDAQQMIAEIDKGLDQVTEYREDYELMLRRIEDFYADALQNLPEELKKRKIVADRILGLEQGDRKAHLYEALKNIRDLLLTVENVEPVKIIEEFTQGFSNNSLESRLINEFVLDYAKRLSLTIEDRNHMVPSNSNLENLLVINNVSSRLADFSDVLQKWLEHKMRDTGFDDLFLTVSPESRVLEEVDLYKASFLAVFEDNKYYGQLVELANRYIDMSKNEFSRVSDLNVLGQIVEMAAIVVKLREQWELVEKYNRYLLTLEGGRYFIRPDKSDKYRAELDLAEALWHRGKEILSVAIFASDRDLREAQLQESDRLLAESRSLLQKLVNLKGDSTFIVITRVQADELLKRMR